MTTRFCSFCGKPLPSTGTFCPSCGAAIPVASPSAGPVGPIPGPAPGPFPMPGYGSVGVRAAAPSPSPASRAEDLRSLPWVEWAAMVGLLSAVISIVVEFFGGGVVALVGGLATLVGLIGILIGVWRLGTRYGDGVFKVSALLLIFPIVSFVGAILILYSAYSHRNRVAAMANAPGPASAR